MRCLTVVLLAPTIALLASCSPGDTPGKESRSEQSAEGAFSLRADKEGVRFKGGDGTDVSVDAESGVRVDAPGLRIRVGPGGVKVDIHDPDDEETVAEE